MIYLNQILTNPYLEEESVSGSIWPEILYLANLISDNFQSTDTDRRHNPRHGIWNDPICLVCQHVSEFTQIQKTMKLKYSENKMKLKYSENKMHVHTIYEWENLNVSTLSCTDILSFYSFCLPTLRPFLIGRMFLCEPSWKYSAKLTGY